MSAADREQETAAPGTQRLDKWLWFARVIKSRTQAAGLVTDGKVRVNRVRAEKPSHALKVGDVVTVSAHSRVLVLKVVAPGARRGPPVEARLLYEDLTPPATDPTGSGGAAADARSAAPTRERGAGRPTKRDRRAIDALRDRRG